MPYYSRAHRELALGLARNFRQLASWRHFRLPKTLRTFAPRLRVRKVLVPLWVEFITNAACWLMHNYCFLGPRRAAGTLQRGYGIHRCQLADRSSQDPTWRKFSDPLHSSMAALSSSWVICSFVCMTHWPVSNATKTLSACQPLAVQSTVSSWLREHSHPPTWAPQIPYTRIPSSTQLGHVLWCLAAVAYFFTLSAGEFILRTPWPDDGGGCSLPLCTPQASGKVKRINKRLKCHKQCFLPLRPSNLMKAGKMGFLRCSCKVSTSSLDLKAEYLSKLLSMQLNKFPLNFWFVSMTFSALQDQRIQLKLFPKQATQKVVNNYLNASQ